MTEANPVNKPSVVILGMPGSGKTVFLSVLGMKFTTTALGAGKAPLGFRLVPAEKTTYFVENSQAKLCNGKWPASTLVEQENGLAWDVLTGRKKQFEIRSFDYAGEVFRKAFGKETASPIDLDIAGDTRAARLYSAAENAGVICLFISLSSDDANTRERIKEAADAAYGILKNPSLKGKCIIVLTQSYERKEEIARIGGPGIFIEREIGASLAQCVEDGVPVIMVSSVNETEYSAENQKKMPGSRFTSDGLLGFLLVVGGRLSPDLEKVGQKYRECLQAGYGYMCAKCGAHGARQRLAKAEAYRDGVAAFRKASEEFLADRANFASPEGEFDDTLLLSYSRAVFGEAEVSFHTEHAAFAMSLERAWQKALGDAAARGGIDTRSCKSTANKVKDILEEELYKGNAGKLVVTDDEIFGFQAADPTGNEAAWLEWTATEIAEISAARRNGAKLKRAKALKTCVKTAACLMPIAAAAWFLSGGDVAAKLRAICRGEGPAQPPVATATGGAKDNATPLAQAEVSPPVVTEAPGETPTNDVETAVGKILELAEEGELAAAAAKTAWARQLPEFSPDVIAKLDAVVTNALISKLGADYVAAEKEGNWTNFFASCENAAAIAEQSGGDARAFNAAIAGLAQGKLATETEALRDAVAKVGEMELRAGFLECRRLESEIENTLAHPLLKSGLANFDEATAMAKDELHALKNELPAFLVLSPFATNTAEDAEISFTAENNEEEKLPVFIEKGIVNPGWPSAVFLVEPRSGDHRFKVKCDGKTFMTRGTFAAGSWHGIRHVAFKIPVPGK